jgi:hypothetical protein
VILATAGNAALSPGEENYLDKLDPIAQAFIKVVGLERVR